MRFFFRVIALMGGILTTLPAFAAGFELTPVAERSSVADFELKDISGKKVRLSDYRGQAVVVSFWATWCEPCKQELGFLSKFHKELRDKGFQVIAVATDAPETQSQIKPLARQKGWEFKVVLDTAGEVSALLNPRGATPYSLFLDRNGNLSYDHEGYTVGDEVHYKPLIESLLKESAASDTKGTGGSLNVTDTLNISYNGDNGDDSNYNDDFFITSNILNLTGNAGNFSAWARVDAVKFWDRPDRHPTKDISGEHPYRKHLELERLNFRYETDSLELIAGDHYLQLGRGIALAIRKGDEVSAETVLRGGKVTHRGETYQIGGFGGTLWNSNTDPVDSKTIEELGDTFGGTFLEFSGIDGVLLGAYGYHQVASPLITLQEDSDWAQVGGAYIDLPGLSDSFTFYAEADMQRRFQAKNFEKGNGIGAFVAGTLSLGATNLLLEGMYLDNFRVEARYPGTSDLFPSPMNRPPTLSRIRDEVISMTDYYGAQARVEHSIKDLGLLLRITGRYRENVVGRDIDENPILVIEYHGFGGVEYLFDGGKSKVSFDGGYRLDQMESNASPIRSLTHGYLSYVQAIGDSYSLNISSDTEYKGYIDEESQTDELAQYWYGSTFLGINKSGFGALTFELGYDTKRDDTRSLFYAGIAKWNMTQDSELRATVGSQRGGLKCVNGVCRIYPAFSGGKVEIISRF